MQAELKPAACKAKGAALATYKAEWTALQATPKYTANATAKASALPTAKHTALVRSAPTEIPRGCGRTRW